MKCEHNQSQNAHLPAKPCGMEMVKLKRRTSRHRFAVYACPRCDNLPGGEATWRQ